MKKQNVRTISLIVSIFTFLLVGAAIFDALESDYEAEDLRRLMTVKNHFMGKYNITDDDFKNISLLAKHLIPHNARQWKFAGAFYYSVTVMTTIGYGHSTPRTWGGKAFTMLYAFVGIPLGLVMFQSIGERLNVFATFLLANIKKCFRFKNAEVSQNNLIVIDTTLALLVVFISAAVFDHYEHWGYFNAVYYCLITLLTVGFGDLVPLQSRESDLEKRPEYVVFTLMFILFGLTVLSANMNLMVLRFMSAHSEEERSDEMAAAVAALTAVKVDGDVIYGNDIMKPPIDQKNKQSMQSTPFLKRLEIDPYANEANNDNTNANSSIGKASLNYKDETTKRSSSVASADASGSNTPVVGAGGTVPASYRRSSSVEAQPGSTTAVRRRPSVAVGAKDSQGQSRMVTTNSAPPVTSTITTQATSTSLAGSHGDKKVKATPAEITTTGICDTNPPLPSPATAASSVARSSSMVSTPNNAPPAECNSSIGQCQMPNCRHINYCLDGPSARNPADACLCSCHQEKAWWSYLLKTMPYSSNNTANNNQPKQVTSSTKLEPERFLKPHLYQQRHSNSKAAGEELPLIPTPIRPTPALPTPKTQQRNNKQGSVNEDDSSSSDNNAADQIRKSPKKHHRRIAAKVDPNVKDESELPVFMNKTSSKAGSTPTESAIGAGTGTTGTRTRTGTLSSGARRPLSSRKS